MKAWLTKFRISAAHDARQPLPAALNQSLEVSPELRQFAQSTQALEGALTATQPQAEPPANLHRSIMRSVQAAAAPAAVPSSFHFLRWLAAPGLALALALGLWVALKPAATPPDPAPLATLGATLEIGSDMPRTLPPALVSPLSDELDRLNHDLSDTAQFLLASLP